MSRRPASLDFERLVREHHPAVYRAALRVSGDAQAAEDVTQQVYLALVEGRLDLRASREERAVLRWWAVRIALGARRAERNRIRREEERVVQQRDEDPAEETARRDERGALERLVAALPEPLRLAVRLRFEEGLSYARVGEALSVSEPVAHERVQRALETLRRRLRTIGLSALALDLEPRLADPPAAAVPAGLVERLAALSSATTAASGWGLVVGAACAATVLAASAWIVLRPDARPEGEHAAATAVAAPHQRPSLAEVAGTDARSVQGSGTSADVSTGEHVAAASGAQEARAWIRGRVVDADGFAVEGARVIAASIERQGKFPREAVQSTTAADGSFELELPVLSADGTSWALSAVHAGLVARREEPLRAPPGQRSEAGLITLAGSSDARPGPWTLTLRILDPAGAPLGGVVVRVFAQARRADGTHSLGSLESQGVSDAGGWVQLGGEGLGGKRVRIDARSRGWRRTELELELGGAHTEIVSLEPGLELRGRLVDARGAPVEPARDEWGLDPQVFASARDVNDWITAQHEPGGRFRIIGLAPEPHRVFLQSPTLSPICLEGVQPGGEELEIVVKRRDEPVDIGPHCAEVHGQLLDARTGEPVAAGWDEVEIEWLPDDPTLDFERDLRPNHLWPRPRQTAAFGELPEPSARFHLVGLRPGRYAAAARVQGFAPALSPPLELETHTLVAGLELRLAVGVRLEGVVRDIDGTPLAGAHVLLTGEGPHSRGLVARLDRDVRETDGRPAAWSRNLAQADERGRFAFEGLPPDLVCTLAALHPRRAPARIDGCRPGQEIRLRFVAERVR